MYGISIIVLAFIGSVLTIPIIVKMFTKHGITDEPGDRKAHIVEKPTMGGIGIFIGFLLSISIWHHYFIEPNYFLAFVALSIIFATGLADDIFTLRARYKLVGQLIATVILVVGCNVRLTSFYGVFGIGELPYFISIILTFFTIIVITNAINLVDGIDGLASSICLSFCIFAGVWFFSIGSYFEAAIANALAGGIIAFLIFNWFPSKIFMGDTGSLLLGFTISWLIIKFITINSTLPETEVFQANAGVSIGIASIIIPLFDALRVFTIRVWKGKSPFSPDKNHLHHIIIRAFQISHGRATIILFGVNLSFLAIAWQLRKVDENIVLFILFVILSVSYFLFIWKMRHMNVTYDKQVKISKRTTVKQ